MSERIRIEFFHDVICSFCFPMSYRMRQIEKKYPHIDIIHRSFALVPTPEAFVNMFGSRERAKPEIIAHWETANRNDDLHRFNVEGMRRTDFPFPSSSNPLLACKAAQILGGEPAYWDMFDALQTALFVENRNIESLECIEQCVIAASLDLEKWKETFHQAETRKALDADLDLVRLYRLRSVPALVINERHVVNGAITLAEIEAVLAKILPTDTASTATSGTSCSLEKGRMNCD